MDKIEEIYDYMQEKIVKDISEDIEFNSIWNELNQLDELMRNNMLKAFAYGYKLSNRLMADSLRE